MPNVKPIRWTNDGAVMRDQRQRPAAIAGHTFFDVAPARLITFIITGHNVASALYTDSLRKVSAAAAARTVPEEI